MKTELKEVSPTQKEIKIEVAPEAIKETYRKVSNKYAHAVQIPGFRKGLAPVEIVRVRYAEEIKNEVLRDLLPEKVADAIREHGLSPLGEPHLHIDDAENIKVDGSQPISLHVHVEVMPEIAAPDYKGIEVTRRVRPVDESELERIIEERLKSNSTFVPVEGRKSKEGDTVIVDLEGVFSDKPDNEPITANDLDIKLGDDNIEKAFSENLVGVTEDEEKEFSVSYAEDFTSPALAGKTINYKAKIKSVGTVELPKADDEWAKSLEEGFESIKDLRKKLREDLEFVAKSEADNKLRDELVTQLIDKHEVEVPNTLIEIQARNLLNNFAQDLQRQGANLEQIGKDFVQMAYERMRGQAERDVRGAMLLEKVAELEKVEVTGDEIATEIDRMAEYYGVKAEDVRNSLTQQGGENSIADRLRSRKAVEVLVDKAKITEGKWEEPGAVTASKAEDTEEKPKKAAKAKKKAE